MSVQNGAFTRTNSFGGDGTRNFPRFHIESVQDHLASERAGRPIFRDEERVEIIMPGNPNTRPVFKVTDEYRQMWPEAYEKFKKGIEMSPEGTPLEEWPILKRGQVLELKALNILTVEHVANLDDLAIQRIGLGGRRLKQLAESFLDDSAKNAIVAKATADNDRIAAENAQLQRQVDELRGLVDSMHSQLQALKNAPNALATHIPGMSDPVEQAKANREPEAVAGSSLDNIGSRRARAR